MRQVLYIVITISDVALMAMMAYLCINSVKQMKKRTRLFEEYIEREAMKND